MAIKFLVFLTLFSVSFFSGSTFMSTSTSTIINDAVRALSLSGYHSMSLILEYASRSIISSPSPSLTIFSPSDYAFKNSGQPTLDLLQFHFSPLAFSLNSLQSLPSGSKIPTFWSNHSLAVTFDDDNVLINGVMIDEFPVFHNGSLVIFGINRFLDPNFHVLDPLSPPTPSHIICIFSVDDDRNKHLFEDASRALRLRGYSIMGNFLDSQLTSFKDHIRLTVFAPTDESFNYSLANISNFRQIFMMHFVPCKVSIIDLSQGLQMETYLDGYVLNSTKIGDSVIINGVEVRTPEIYSNSWLVVHGLDDSFLPEELPKTRLNLTNCANAFYDCGFFTAFILLVTIFFVFQDGFIGVVAVIFLILLSKHC